jgi:hypothetical protein
VMAARQPHLYNFTAYTFFSNFFTPAIRQVILLPQRGILQRGITQCGISQCDTPPKPSMKKG